MRTVLFAGLMTTLPFAAMAQSFHGPYVGAELGYSETDVKFTLTGVGSETLDDSGVRFGAIAGYRQNNNGFVWGVEGRVGDAKNAIVLTDGFDTVTMSSGFEWSVNGIAGYAVSDNVLLFGVVGYANMRGKGDVNGDSDSSNLDGIRFGGGVEFAVADRLSLRATVSRANFGSLLSDEEALMLGVDAKVKQTQFDAGLIFSF